MANTVPQSGRAGGGRRWRAPTRGNLLTFLLAAMLCSAAYCLGLGIWHNSRGAADSRVLEPSAVGATSSCGGGADEELDFEAHHVAESAGLSVSASSAAAARTTGAQRALRDTGTALATRGMARAWNPVAGAEATAAGQ
ncbi:uncharacterized protein LOC112873170 [Panicum hallii]|jgi:hypothetical protein|uniref:uncharacterized protein LOC112873170 n=1 Tax=Panicum hallii TaxID=206008 RepID=UPI000BC2AF33|nr:uncharacterized protein LOC112873170 [Panicum hallii]